MKKSKKIIKEVDLSKMLTVLIGIYVFLPLLVKCHYEVTGIVTGIILCIFYYQQMKAHGLQLSRNLGRVSVMFYILGTWGFLQLILLFTENNFGKENLIKGIGMLYSCLLYFGVMKQKRFKTDYLHIVVHGTSCFNVVFVFWCLFEPSILKSFLGAESQWTMIATGSLTVVIGAVLYAEEQKKYMQWLYGTETAISFIALLLCNSKFGLYIATAMLLILLELGYSNKERIKRYLQLLCVLGLTICNFSIVAVLLGVMWEKRICMSAKECLWLGVIMAIEGYYTWKKWDGINEINLSKRKQKLYQLRKNGNRILGICLFCFLLFSMWGNEEIIRQSKDGLIYCIYKEYGSVGMICLLGCETLMLEQIIKNRQVFWYENQCLMVCAILLGVLQLFTCFTIKVFPIYLLLLIFALVPGMQYERCIKEKGDYANEK